MESDVSDENFIFLYISDTFLLSNSKSAVNIEGVHLKVQRSVFINNTSEFGGGAAINCSRASIDLENVTINFNDGAIRCADSELSIKGCLFRGNYYRGAISLSYSELWIEKCLFKDNYAIREGGAIKTFFSNLSVSTKHFHK